jgi:hypothetical protein
MAGRSLPAPLVDLDEKELPQVVRDEIARMVALGYRRRHLMVGSDLRVYVDPELAMLYGDDPDDLGPDA